MTEDPNAALSRQEYWDERYSSKESDEAHYDWLRKFETVKPFLTKHLPPVTDEAKILHLGNGNSVNADDPLFSASLTPKQTLPASLSKLGYDGQTAIDFSPVVIAKMAELHPEVRWDVMDIRHLSYPDSSFDVCIDKATLDAMLYGSLWDPEDEIKANVASYVDEVARVLKPGGVWLYITWRQPHFIRPLIERAGVWQLELETITEGAGMFEYFGFVVTKR